MPILPTPCRAAIAALVLLPFAALPAFAQEPPREDLSRIVVTGEGETALAPDMAILTLTVLREGDTARAALDASNQAMEEVLQAMREEGVGERDLQTSGFSIQPRYTQPQEDRPEEGPRITGYEVANTLTVRLRDLDKLGTVLDRAVSLGVNRGGDIQFINDDPDKALADARREAVEDARARAETLAEAAGVSLGRVLRIDETASPGMPMPMARMEANSYAADAGVPIAQGENRYRVNVTMSFAIGQEDGSSPGAAQ